MDIKNLPGKKYYSLIIIVLIVALYAALGIQKVILLRPQSIHQWAQCDRASVALNYYRDGMNLFLPRVHNLDNGTGVTGLEFPFVNYCAAILYKIFGYHEFLYRLLSLFIFTSGLYFAFRISFFWLKNFWKSAGVTLLFACSPVLVFFAPNFLPEPSCLGFALGAWYFITRYLEEKKKKYLWYWCLLMLLSCLIKLSALINLPAMLLLIWMNEGSKNRKKIILSLAIKSVIITAVTFLWYAYAKWLSTKTQSELFLLESKFPANMEVVIDVWKQMRRDWFSRIYSDAVLILIFVSVVAGLIIKKIKEKQLFIISLVLFLTSLCFLFSMWTQLRHHDYYVIPMFTVLLFGMIAFVKVTGALPEKLSSALLLIVLPVLISYQFYDSKTHLRICYKKDSWKYSPLYNDQYFFLNDVLRNAGIKPEDRVICLFDTSPEISLYLMDQHGVTVAYRNSEMVFEQYLNSGMFKYVIFNEASKFDQYDFHPEQYPLTKIVENSSVKIYSVSSEINLQKNKTKYPALLSPWN